MKYTVYEGNKPAVMGRTSFKCWENATFITRRDAEIYAYLWCYPVTREEAEQAAPTMDVGKKYDFSMCEIPLWMSIQEGE